MFYMTSNTPHESQRGAWAPFPVDEVTLSLMEASLDVAYDDVDDEGGPIVSDGRYTFHKFLEFMSGYNPELLIPLEETGWFEYPDPQYTYKDVIRSLIDEVRRLRNTSGTIEVS